jgi:hypothetical protein
VVPWSAASPAATRKSNGRRSRCRQVATTVSSRSANRLPAALSAPKLPVRQRTAGRKARSATLLVGSTPSTRAKVHARASSTMGARAALQKHYCAYRLSVLKPYHDLLTYTCRFDDQPRL